MTDIAVKENRLDDAKYYLQVLENTNTLFDLWEYNTYAAYFQLYTRLRDSEKFIETLKKMLQALSKKWQPSKSRLYSHIKGHEGTYHQDMCKSFINNMNNDPDHELDFVKEHPEFIALLNDVSLH